jgi:hypothetical protein
MSMPHVWQRYRRLQVAYGVVWLLLMALPILVYAEQFTGKVVGISDGDTILERPRSRLGIGPRGMVGHSGARRRRTRAMRLRSPSSRPAGGRRALARRRRCCAPLRHARPALPAIREQPRLGTCTVPV